MPALTSAQEALVRHVTAFFDGHEIDVEPFTEGPIEERVPGFVVVHAAPGPRTSMHTYVSCGTWDAMHVDEHGLEFCIVAPQADDCHRLYLAMNAFYHANPDPSFRLDVGHTVPLGDPWLPGSKLDHWLISLPYPYGREFELCEWEGGHARILWMLPITESERDFRSAHGLEALEQRFDDAELPYWDPDRAPVV